MTTTHVHDSDPYVLTARDVRQPPKGFKESIRYLGPGLIIGASIVGSGELIATTALGAQAGFAILWMVIVSTLVKVAVQMELARWAISTGTPSLTGYNRVPPRIGRIGWVNLLWILLALTKIFQVGGIVGAVAVAFSILIPFGNDPFAFTSIAIWTAFVVVATIALLVSNRYGLIERVSVMLVAVFSVVTVAVAAILPFTQFSFGLSDITGGLAFQIPAGTLGAAVAMFGLTGVSVDEITEYPYWCIEKGYARWTGRAEQTEDWYERANGWIRVMYRDAILSWVIYTITTSAFFVLGAAILKPQGLVPEGEQMVSVLSRIYTDAIGEWAGILFLVGAIATLGSTLWAGTPAWARMFTNFLATTGAIDWFDQTARIRWTRVFIIALPIIWGIAYLFIQSPLIMVQIGGFGSGMFLLAAVVAVWYLRRTEIDARLAGGRSYFVALVVSSLAIALIGVYTAASVFGFSIG